MPPFVSTINAAIGIATRGRAEILNETLREIRSQTYQPDRLIVCYTAPADILGLDDRPDVEFVTASPGLPRQRNTILDLVSDCDVLIFLDDDFFPSKHYLEATLSAFDAHPDIAGSTGIVLSDGTRGPGITPEQARAILENDRDKWSEDASDAGVIDVAHGYGCNMAIRLATAREHQLRFDERLPLYAWSEDMDYSLRLRFHGRFVKLTGAQGVHLGTKRGRSPGKSLGYSQVANPIYLYAKGSYTWSRACRSVGRNLIANLAKSPFPEPWVDRRGRLQGNGIAFMDWLRGRMAPERVLDL